MKSNFYSTTWLNTPSRSSCVHDLSENCAERGVQFRICSILQRNTEVKFSSITCSPSSSTAFYNVSRNSVWQSVKTQKSISRQIRWQDITRTIPLRALPSVLFSACENMNIAASRYPATRRISIYVHTVEETRRMNMSRCFEHLHDK